MSHALQPHGMTLSIEFSRQEYWSGLTFPSPGDHPDLGIRPKDQTQAFCIAGRFFIICAIIIYSLDSNFVGRIKKLCSISCLLLVPMPASRHVLGSGFSSKISWLSWLSALVLWVMQRRKLKGEGIRHFPEVAYGRDCL